MPFNILPFLLLWLKYSNDIINFIMSITCTIVIYNQSKRRWMVRRLSYDF